MRGVELVVVGGAIVKVVFSPDVMLAFDLIFSIS